MSERERAKPFHEPHPTPPLQKKTLKKTHAPHHHLHPNSKHERPDKAKARHRTEQTHTHIHTNPGRRPQSPHPFYTPTYPACGLTERVDGTGGHGGGPPVEVEQLLGDLLVQLHAVALPARARPVRLLAALIQVLQLLRLGQVLLEVVRGAVSERQETLRHHCHCPEEAYVAAVVTLAVVNSPGLHTLVQVKHSMVQVRKHG